MVLADLPSGRRVSRITQIREKEGISRKPKVKSGRVTRLMTIVPAMGELRQAQG